VQYGAHKTKFKSYIGLDVNKVCGINKYQKPKGFAAAERADRLRPGLSAKSVVCSSKHAEIEKLIGRKSSKARLMFQARSAIFPFARS
jgi:hypothetical protein